MASHRVHALAVPIPAATVTGVYVGQFLRCENAVGLAGDETRGR